MIATFYSTRNTRGFLRSGKRAFMAKQTLVVLTAMEVTQALMR
jgi:hypothetical protein